MDDILNSEWIKKSLSIGGMNIGTRRRESVLDSQQAGVLKERGPSVNNMRSDKKENKHKRNASATRGLSYCVQNDIIRQFLERNDMSSVQGIGEATTLKNKTEFSSTNGDNKDENIVHKEAENVPSKDSEERKEVLSFAIRKERLRNEKRFNTPRGKSPGSQCDARKLKLVDIINGDIKNALEHSTSLVDLDTELFVEQKHYDKWARSKRQVVSRFSVPDPRFMKLKLSKEAFCFSSVSLDFGIENNDHDSWDYDFKTAHTHSQTHDHFDGEKQRYFTESDGKYNELDLSNNQQTEVNESDNTCYMQGYGQLVEETQSKIVSDIEMLRQRADEYRRRCSQMLNSDLIRSLRETCSEVITLARRNDDKLNFARGLSRSEVSLTNEECCHKQTLHRSCLTSGAVTRRRVDESRSDRNEEIYQEIAGENYGDISNEHRNIDQGCDGGNQEVNASINCAPSCDDAIPDAIFENDSEPSDDKLWRNKLKAFKVPLPISKRSPIFSRKDNVLVDFQSKRIEEHLSRVQNRNDTPTRILKRNLYTKEGVPRQINYKSNNCIVKSPSSGKDCGKQTANEIFSERPMRLRDFDFWKSRSQSDRSKSYRITLGGNRIVVKNRHGELIDHVNLRFLAPLLMNSDKYAIKNQ